MDIQEYIKIGSEIKYMRHDNDLIVHKESGIVRAIFVDQQNRLMVQVKRGENAYNVHYSTLCDEHSDESAKKYGELLQNIRTTSDEGDALVQDIVEQYNGQVQNLTTAALGEPIEFEIIEFNEVENAPTLEQVAGSV